ncbi:MAG: ATP-dependent helicase, partial [Planctomycetaceae bacterium]
TAATEYDEAHLDDPSVTGFLETTSLMNDDDLIDSSAGQVTLMTMHAAKGLEFPAVVIVGLEHGLIPHERSIKSDDSSQLEEERRLLFVGMTRAMNHLYLTTAQMRSERGAPRLTIPSNFLSETEYVQGDFQSGEQTQAGSPEPEFKRRKKDIREHLRQQLNNASGPLLTTGAALLAGQAAEVSLPLSFAVGMRVRHPRHGMGTVTGISGFSKKRTVTVEFCEDARIETYRVSHCPLQPVGGR